MASKSIYSIVAVLGIAAASAAAWWYQTRPQVPREASTSSPGAGRTATAPAGAASGPRLAGVEVATVERLTLRDDAQSVGSLRSRQSVMLRPEVPGRVLALGFTDGATVRRGQVLVQMDDTLQRADIKQAQAQVSIAQANFRRNQELVAQNFIARRVLDESQASLQVAEAQLGLACARWSRMAILAPFAGTVGIRNINVGDFVKDGADLVNLEDTSSMYVDFRLPERFQTRVRKGQTVEMQLDSIPGRMFKAQVEAIDPLLDVNGRSVGVRAVLPNSMGEPLVQPARGGAAGAPAAAGSRPAAARAAASGTRPDARRPAQGARAQAGGPAPAPPTPQPVTLEGCPPPAIPVAATSSASVRVGEAGGPLRPGMFARVTPVFAIKEGALSVPEEAIVPQGGRQFVIKVVAPAALPATAASGIAPDTKFVSLRQEVRLGVRQTGKVEITEGLAQGETVVVAGQQRLQRDGTPVRIVETTSVPGLGRPSPPASAAVAAASQAASPPKP